MFQNKRRRYSHESRRDTVRRRPLPDISAVQDPGRCQVDLLLDVLLQCLFDRFGSVFPQCGLMVFPGVVIVSR